MPGGNLQCFGFGVERVFAADDEPAAHQTGGARVAVQLLFNQRLVRVASQPAVGPRHRRRPAPAAAAPGSASASSRRALAAPRRGLAERAGVSVTSIAEAEQGKRELRADTIRRLCDALGVQVVYRIDGTEITGP